MATGKKKNGGSVCRETMFKCRCEGVEFGRRTGTKSKTTVVRRVNSDVLDLARKLLETKYCVLRFGFISMCCEGNGKDVCFLSFCWSSCSFPTVKKRATVWGKHDDRLLSRRLRVRVRGGCETCPGRPSVTGCDSCTSLVPWTSVLTGGVAAAPCAYPIPLSVCGVSPA